MFIDYDFLNAIKDNPESLKKFVELHNDCEGADDDYVTILQDFFNDYARKPDYDVEFYNETLNNLTKADNAYNEFVKEVKRHIFVPSKG